MGSGLQCCNSPEFIIPSRRVEIAILHARSCAANEIRDMNYPGSNLHKLAGDKKDQYAVKVSGNWRVFFQFIGGDAYIVDYDDYH